MSLTVYLCEELANQQLAKGARPPMTERSTGNKQAAVGAVGGSAPQKPTL